MICLLHGDVVRRIQGGVTKTDFKGSASLSISIVIVVNRNNKSATGPFERTLGHEEATKTMQPTGDTSVRRWESKMSDKKCNQVNKIMRVSISHFAEQVLSSIDLQ